MTRDEYAAAIEALLGSGELRRRYDHDPAVSGVVRHAAGHGWTRERMLEVLAERLAYERDAYRVAATSLIQTDLTRVLVVNMGEYGPVTDAAEPSTSSLGSKRAVGFGVGNPAKRWTFDGSVGPKGDVE